MSGVSGSSWPVSSANSRRATATSSSPSSTSPLGIVQCPRSLFTQYGPPWCASSTSRRWFRRRQSRMPALVRPDLSVVTATSLAILRPIAAARMARWSRYLLARPSLNPHANRCISTDRTVSTREIHILLHAQYLASTPPRLVLSLQTIFRGEQCTRGALLAPTKAGGERRGGGRHRQALGRAGGVLHPRAGHRPPAVPVWPR